MLLAGVVDQHIELAEGVDDLADRPEAEFLRPEIPRNGDGAAPFRLHDALGFRGVVMFAQIEDRNVGAFAREQGRNRAPDAAVGAGDDRYLAVQSPRPGIARCPVGLGLQLAFVPRKRIFVDRRVDRIGHRQPWREASWRVCEGVAREADAGTALVARHSATTVGKSSAVVPASADPIAATQVARLSNRVGTNATCWHAAEPSAQPRIAIRYVTGPMRLILEELARITRR